MHQVAITALCPAVTVTAERFWLKLFFLLLNSDESFFVQVDFGSAKKAPNPPKDQKKEDPKDEKTKNGEKNEEVLQKEEEIADNKKKDGLEDVKKP